MKDNFKTNPLNQKSSKMILIWWRNRKLKWREISDVKIHDFKLKFDEIRI